MHHTVGWRRPCTLEKPMAITTEGCDRILEAAELGKAKLFVGHNMRHFGVVRKMKEWIDEEGRVTRRKSKRLGAGTS